MNVDYIHDINTGWHDLLPRTMITETLEIDDYQSSLTEQERLFLSNSAKRRIAEFSTSRFVIKQLLKNDKQSILMCEKGSPAWPKDWTGSISHSKNICSVSVAKRKNHQSIGIDLETRHRIKTKIWNKIASNEEIESLKEIACEVGFPMKDLMTVLFSAKEAFYKFQYPITQKWIGFKEAKFNMLDSENGSICMISQNHQASRIAKDCKIKFRILSNHVISAAFC